MPASNSSPIDSNKDPWVPPPAPLTPELIQRGKTPVFHVMHEHATDPFGPELEHWSALPALSYFASNAVALRESRRRIQPPTKFRPPPRVTLSDVRCRYWLNDLCNPQVPSRKLARTIPHGYSGLKSLQTVLQLRVPIGRAVWFVRCIGANEVRVLKRKAGLGDGGAERNEPIEQAWLQQWTVAIEHLVLEVVDSFDDLSLGKAQNTGSDPVKPNMNINSEQYSPETSTENDTKNNDLSNDPNNEKTEASQSDLNEQNDEYVSDVDDLFAEDDEIAAHAAKKQAASSAASSAASEAAASSQRAAARARKWQERMEYTSHLVMSSYNESLSDRQSLLDWLSRELRHASVTRLPCFVHFVQLLWTPMTSNYMAPQLLRSVAVRLSRPVSKSSNSSISPAEDVPESTAEVEDDSMHPVVTSILEPIIFKSLSTNDNAFVTPRTWPLIEPYVRSHPGYARLVERNQAFMTKDPHDPSDWSQLSIVGTSMSGFARPYHIDELVHNSRNLDISNSMLVKTILSHTVRLGTSASNLSCITSLKRLRDLTPQLDIADSAVDFLLEVHPEHTSPYLNALICELIPQKLFHLSKYLNRVILRDLLFSGDPARQSHLDVLCSLRLDRSNPSVRTQITMMLKNAGVPAPVLTQSSDLDSFVAHAVTLATQKHGRGLALIDTAQFSLIDQRKVATKLVAAFIECQSLPEPAAFAEFCGSVGRASVGTVQPLAQLLSTAVLSSEASPLFVSGVIRQVHIRLMEFVCSGAITSFCRNLVTKLECSSRDDPTFLDGIARWVSWDDINALRSVIQEPAIMFESSRLMPLRPVDHANMSLTTTAGNTPMERDTVRSLLHRPSPDIVQSLHLRGDEGLQEAVSEYARSSEADRAASLQIVAYSAANISELIVPISEIVNDQASAQEKDLVRYLLSAPANELGFCPEEVEALKYHRHQFLWTLAPMEFLKLCMVLDSYRFASRTAHLYTDVFEAKMVKRAIESPEYHEAFRKCMGKIPSFDFLLTTCTPFNLRFRQGMICSKYHEVDPETVAREILDAAYAHPSHSSASQGLLHTVSVEAKNLIFTKTVKLFLNEGLTPGFLAMIDVPYTLIGALAAIVRPPSQWDFGKIPNFLSRLVELAENCSVHTNQTALRKALILVLRISVVARLNHVEMSASAVPYLDRLLHIELFSDDHRMRTTIEDALRLSLRIAKPQESRLYSGGDQQLVAGGGAADGSRSYSKSSDKYGPLPVWSFDLIEETSNGTGNDAPIDLSLFEAYTY